jgi:predicted metal-dependent hydrolase
MSGVLMEENRIETKDFKSIVWDWAIKLKVEPKEIHLRSMRTKWASLSGAGRLTFNSELLDKRRNLIDYVIVHELLHIKVPNHGKLFKSLMFAFLPEWEKCSCLLKEPI